MKIAVIAAQFNKEVTDRLLDGALRGLREGGIEVIEIFEVPGCFEIPYMAKKIAVSVRTPHGGRARRNPGGHSGRVAG